MRRLKSLLEVKFAPLRKGRVHLRCPGCGRPQSNAKASEFDPPGTVFVEGCCENCCVGHKDCGGRYFDANGKELDPFGEEE